MIDSLKREREEGDSESRIEGVKEDFEGDDVTMEVDLVDLERDGSEIERGVEWKTGTGGFDGGRVGGKRG